MNELKILVIDDDEDIGIMISMTLQFRGYTVIVLESAENAEQTLQQNQVGMILMDMLLSGSNGIDICSKLKSNPLLAHVPLVMMSAHPDARKICIEAGADDFISKPFDIDDLFSMVEKFIPHQPAAKK